MMNKNNIVIITFSALLIILVIDNIRLRIERSKLHEEVAYQTDLNSQIETRITEIIDEHNSRLAELDIKNLDEIDSIKDLIPPMHNVTFSRLKRKGLNNPLEYIREDLMKNQDLIPNRITPKGPMYFWKDYIFLINSKWVYAYYEEGHYGGELIAEFEINDNGDIDWKVLAYTNE